MSDLSVTQDFINVFCEFVEAVIHQILHLRSVYKPDLFERHRLYGITTRKSRHPELNEYIHSVATSLKVLISFMPHVCVSQFQQMCPQKFFKFAPGCTAARTASQDKCQHPGNRQSACGEVRATNSGTATQVQRFNQCMLVKYAAAGGHA